jgi:hypothetical protein
MMNHGVDVGQRRLVDKEKWAARFKVLFEASVLCRRQPFWRATPLPEHCVRPSRSTHGRPRHEVGESLAEAVPAETAARYGRGCRPVALGWRWGGCPAEV